MSYKWEKSGAHILKTRLNVNSTYPVCAAKRPQSDSGATNGASPHPLLVFLEHHATQHCGAPNSCSHEVIRSQEKTGTAYYAKRP